MEPQPSVYYTDTETRKSYDKVGRLYQAIEKRRRIACIEHLVQSEGDINYRILGGVPDLLYAAWDECEPFHLLLEYGADFTDKDKEGRTALLRKIEKEAVGDLLGYGQFQDRHVKLILDTHVKLNNFSNPCDEHGMSHFHVACMTNNAAAVEFFLKNRVDVHQALNADSPYFALDTPLHFAVKFICPETVGILLKYGANTLLKNAVGLSPLHLLIELFVEVSPSRDLEKTHTFFKCAISHLNDADNYDFSKLQVACFVQDQSLIDSVLAEGTDINQAVNFDCSICPGFTALHFATFVNMQTFILLLRRGADAHAKNAKGQTPFDLCLQKYNVTEIHAVLSTREEWRNIVFSDEKTKLLTVVSAMENMDKFTSFLNRNKSASTLYVPFDSPLWPGYTMLHLAVVFTRKISDPEVSFYNQKDDIKIVAECLKGGADSTVADATGSTALHLAFYMGKRSVVDYFLDHHQEIINPIDKANLSHFHIACAAGHLKTIEHFLSYCVNVNLPVLSTYSMWHFYICPGSTALHISIGSRADKKNEIIKKMLEHGADVNAQDVNSFTPVHRLLLSQMHDFEEKMYDLLLSVDNLQNVVSNSGLSHLHVACYFHHTKAIEKLLELGADINAPWTGRCNLDYRKDYHNFYLLPYEDPDKLSRLLSFYAGSTPLHFAFYRRHDWSTIFMLIDRGADLMVKNAKGDSAVQTLLRKVASDDRDFRCSMLYENVGVRVCLDENFGITNLHLACLFDDPDVELVRNLIDGGANVNARVHRESPVWQGRTPLHFTVEKVVDRCRDERSFGKYIPVIRLLIDRGADPLLGDNKNKTPCHLLKSYTVESPSVLSILFESIKNFNVNPKNEHGLSLFHMACMSGNAVIIRKYLAHGVDVNQAVSHFSKRHPGCTALHLLAEYHTLLRESSTWCDGSDETFLQIIDKLLEMGADVDATDATGNSTLAKVVAFREYKLRKHGVKLTELRRVLIEKFIRNVHSRNVLGNSAFELLQVQGNATWEEIELFLQAGCRFNVFNPVTQVGLMADIFAFRGKEKSESYIIMDNPIFRKIIEDPKITEVDSAGRTAIHNVVSIHNYDDERRGTYQFVDVPSHDPTLHYYDFFTEVIEELATRGCDVDDANFEGKTALHLAVLFKNHRAVLSLLKNGADINIADKNGKTAFAYCEKPTLPSPYTGEGPDYLIDEDANNANEYLAKHVLKLEFCGMTVNDQNKKIQVEVCEILGLTGREQHWLMKEIEKVKALKIGTTSLSIYEFLMSTDLYTIYTQMTSEGREEVDHFIENVRKHNFWEIGGVLKCKYRQTIEKMKLIEGALASLNVLSKRELPDLCCRLILKFLDAGDLKRLIIASAA